MNEPMNSFYLVKMDGDEITIDRRMIVGRLPECTLQLTGEGISRLHAQIEVVEGKAIITDLGSRNGTWVNDEKITAPAELKDRDRIRISKMEFTFRCKATAPEAEERTIEDFLPVDQAPGELLEVQGESPKTMSWMSKIPMTLVRSDSGGEYGLNRQTRIGRDGSNDVVLENDTSASGFHARVEVVSGRVVVSDLGSANGTWVNGKRIMGPTVLNHGDRIRLGNRMFRLRVGDRPLPALDAALQPAKARGQKWVLPVVITGLLGLGAIIILVLSGILILPWIQENSREEAQDRALRSLVMVIVPVGDAQDTDEASMGSGSLINSTGIVVTNFHVIGQTETGMYYNDQGIVYIGINHADPQAEPDSFYRANILATDSQLDLAVVQIVATEYGDPLPAGTSFPHIPIGNSDDLAIGDAITVIGFPSTGMTTPTFTNGVVSGFFADGSLTQGWIKTDAEISSGNSGGMAIDEKSTLVGIPTIVVTGESTMGKIGYIRPINLVLPIIRSYLP